MDGPAVFNPLADQCIMTLAVSHRYDFKRVSMHLTVFGLFFTSEQCRVRYLRLAALTAEFVQSTQQTLVQPSQSTELQRATDQNQLTLASENDGQQTLELNLTDARSGIQGAQQEQQPESNSTSIETSGIQYESVQMPHEHLPILGHLDLSRTQDDRQPSQSQVVAQVPAQHTAQNLFPAAAASFQPHPDGALIHAQRGLFVERVLGQQSNSPLHNVWDFADAQDAQTAESNMLDWNFGGAGDMYFEPSFSDTFMNVDNNDSFTDGFATPNQDASTFPNPFSSSAQVTAGQPQSTLVQQPQTESAPAAKPQGRPRKATATDRDPNPSRSSGIQKRTGKSIKQAKWTPASMPHLETAVKGHFWDISDDEFLRQTVAAIGIEGVGSSADEWETVARAFADRPRPWIARQCAMRWEKCLFSSHELSLARKPPRTAIAWTPQQDLLAFQGVLDGKTYAEIQMTEGLHQKTCDSIKKRVSNLRLNAEISDVIEKLSAIVVRDAAQASSDAAEVGEPEQWWEQGA